MLRSAQPSQFSTYPSQYIDTPVLAVLKYPGPSLTGRSIQCASSPYILTSPGSVDGSCKTELLLTAQCLLSTALRTGAR